MYRPCRFLGIVWGTYGSIRFVGIWFIPGNKTSKFVASSFISILGLACEERDELGPSYQMCLKNEERFYRVASIPFSGICQAIWRVPEMYDSLYNMSLGSVATTVNMRLIVFCEFLYVNKTLIKKKFLALQKVSSWARKFRRIALYWRIKVSSVYL